MPTKMLGIALRRVTAFAVGALSLLSAPAAAAEPAPTPTPSECIGDCDNMGQVTVNELLEMVNIALGLDAVSTCAAGDANHDGTVTVDEILKAVNLALTRCPLTGSAAAEAASGVDESTNDGVDAAGGIIDFGKASAGGGGAAVVSSNVSAGGGAAAFFSCPGGGNVDIASCDSSKGASTLTAVFTECREVDRITQATTMRTGTLKLSVADPSVCAAGQIPPGLPTMSVFTRFMVVTRDAAGETVTQIDKLTDSFTPSGQGCDGFDGRDLLRGALTVQRSLPGAVNPTAAYTYRDFAIDTVSTAGPAACIVQKTINGMLTVDDPGAGRNFSETAQDFVITSQQLDNQQVVTEAGTLTVDCLGQTQFKTIKPLRSAPPSSCPFSGVLEVTLPDGTVSQTGFSPDGVAFDFNNDGEIDKRVTNCLDASLTRCTDSAPAS